MSDSDVEMVEAAEVSTRRKTATIPNIGDEKVEMDMPWLEKYRPKYLDDVVGNEETIARLKVIAQHGNMTNLIISGPPGTGKTTSIHCLARELLGEESYKTAVLELNASDDRGIDVVRNRIKMFAQQKVTLPPGRHKIIILDEADNMTSSAQQALRRTMELYSSTTRFALACNISSKVIEPIQSRCAILRYTRLSDEQIMTRLVQILDMENVLGRTTDGLKALIFIADGDMRNAINSAQATFSGFGHISDTTVYKVCDVPHPVKMREILDACSKMEVSEALRNLLALLRQGFSTLDFISTLFRVTKTYQSDRIDERKKLEWIKEMGFTHARIADGVDSELQLSGLIAKMCLIAKG